jgi:hypothetical protein
VDARLETNPLRSADHRFAIECTSSRCQGPCEVYQVVREEGFHLSLERPTKYHFQREIGPGDAL